MFWEPLACCDRVSAQQPQVNYSKVSDQDMLRAIVFPLPPSVWMLVFFFAMSNYARAYYCTTHLTDPNSMRAFFVFWSRDSRASLERKSVLSIVWVHHL